MSLQHILFDHDPSLARFLQKAPSSARGLLSAAMAAAALDANGLADPVADRVLRAIEVGADVSQADGEWIRRRTGELDGAYLDGAEELGDDESREHEVLDLFWRARAMSALQNACDVTSSEALLATAYEALHALALDSTRLRAAAGLAG